MAMPRASPDYARQDGEGLRMALPEDVHFKQQVQRCALLAFQNTPVNMMLVTLPTVTRISSHTFIGENGSRNAFDGIYSSIGD